MDHPFIIKYYDRFIYSEKECIVTELASGGNLKDLETSKMNLTEDESMDYFTMILLGLNFIHK